MPTPKSFNLVTSSIVCFDLDGTLIQTDKANNLAYEKAVRWVLGHNMTLPSEPGQRFEKKSLMTSFPHLSDHETQAIVSLKGVFYNEFLAETHINSSIFEQLKMSAEHKLTILITKANIKRAKMLLEYHRLTEYFQAFFSLDQVSGSHNKYAAAFNSLGINQLAQVSVFDNEIGELGDALIAGVQQQHLFLV
jgi:beta-phosphoglucomutase